MNAEPLSLPPYFPPQQQIPIYIHYYEEWRRLTNDYASINDFPSIETFMFDRKCREQWVKEFSWAIPNPEALRAIQHLGSPIVEIGAGSGYWGYLLRCLGIRCYLYDINPPDTCDNHWASRGTQWTYVAKGDVECLDRHPDCTLFLCWPPYQDDMALRAAERYTGQYLIYVGEGYGGCTGCDEFHQLLHNQFDECKRIDIPQFYGLHDELVIYKRKA